jgi:hypothetical protein
MSKSILEKRLDALEKDVGFKADVGATALTFKDIGDRVDMLEKSNMAKQRHSISLHIKLGKLEDQMSKDSRYVNCGSFPDRRYGNDQRVIECVCTCPGHSRRKGERRKVQEMICMDYRKGERRKDGS